MSERGESYKQKVEKLIKIISDPDFGKNAKIVPENEDHSARLATAHFGGNIVGSRLVSLAEHTTPFHPPEEDRERLLEGLASVDVGKLSPDKAQEFEQIKQEALTGDWNDEAFIRKLSLHCGNFSAEKPLDAPKTPHRR